jgi:HSP20 family protein
VAVSEKAKETHDEASKEIKEAIDSLKQEVAGLTNKVKEKPKGAGEEMRESSEELTQELRTLSEKVKELIPKRRRRHQLPVQIERHSDLPPDAWEPFLELRNATDHLFDEFFQSFRGPMAEWRSPWRLTTDILDRTWPRVDMDESDEEIRITAELPGVDKDNIDISMTDDRITIRGEKKEQEEKGGRDYYKVELSYGSFQRSFHLPCEVETGMVQASFENGVLTVKFPKSAAARERVKKIPVRTG